MFVVVRCILADVSAFSSTKCSVVSKTHALMFWLDGGSPIIELSYTSPCACVDENKKFSTNKTLRSLLYILKMMFKVKIKFYIIDS